MLLILGTNDDAHIQSVCNLLNASGCEFYIIDHRNLTNMGLFLSDNGEIHLSIDEKNIPCPSIVWDRNKIFIKFYDGNSESREAFYCSTQWLGLSRDLLYLFQDKLANGNLSAHLNNFKVNQMRTAQQYGFKIPHTLISNTRSEALNFIEKYQTVITKPIGASNIPALHNERKLQPIAAKRVNRADLIAVTDQEFRTAPELFQQEIKKEFEIRCAVIENIVFPFKVRSQESVLTEVDWRHGNHHDIFEPMKIDATLKDNMVKLVAALGLRYGQLDLIVDPVGDIWFLECNPEGQWEWLDRILQGKISQAYADLFMQLENQSA